MDKENIGVTDREVRYLRRREMEDRRYGGGLTEEKGRRLKAIRERDRQITEQQMEEFRRQRAMLQEARRSSKHRDAAGQANINPRDADIENIDDLTKQVHDLELEVGRLQGFDSTNQKAVLDYLSRIEDDRSTERPTVLEDVTNTGNVQDRSKLSQICTNEYKELGARPKTRVCNKTLMTVDAWGNVDEVSYIRDNLDDTRYASLSSVKDEERTVDSLHQSFYWIDRRYEAMCKEDSEDRIILEGEDEMKKDEDGLRIGVSEEEMIIRKQIERMKLEERQLIEDIRRKRQLREDKLRNDQEEERKSKQDRIRKLLEEKEELQQSILEKATTLSTISGQIRTKGSGHGPTREGNLEKKTQRRKLPEIPQAAREKNQQPLIFKPNVPKLSDPQAFPEWKVEIIGMLESEVYNEEVLRQSVRNAITGTPRKVLSTIKATASLTEMLETLESNYGNIKSGDTLMEEFYVAKQQNGEDLSAWAIRLEKILQLAIDKGQVDEEKKEEMLRKRFWRKLQSTELRNSTRVYFEAATSFEELKKKIREEEMEMKPAGKPSDKEAQVLTQDVDEQTKLLRDLTDQVKAMGRKLENFEKDRERQGVQQTTPFGQRFGNRRGRDYYRGQDRGRSFNRNRRREQSTRNRYNQTRSSTNTNTQDRNSPLNANKL